MGLTPLAGFLGGFNPIPSEGDDDVIFHGLIRMQNSASRIRSWHLAIFSVCQSPSCRFIGSFRPFVKRFLIFLGLLHLTYSVIVPATERHVLLHRCHIWAIEEGNSYRRMPPASATFTFKKKRKIMKWICWTSTSWRFWNVR